MDNAKLVADAHKIARCVRGCATDAQYQELTANIEAALASANEMNERLVSCARIAAPMLDRLAHYEGNVNQPAKALADEIRALLQSIPNKGDGQ